MTNGPRMERLFMDYHNYGNKYYDNDNYINQFMDSHIRGGKLPPTKDNLGFLSLDDNGNEFLDDITTEYILNEYGYRSKDFTTNENIVYAGCSFSFGIGVPEQYIWGTKVSKYLNKPYSNLSRPGFSVMEIVQNLFAYFKHFGNPEYLFCLFPDLYRIAIASSVGRLVSDKDVDKHSLTDAFRCLHLYNKKETNDVPLFSKAPHKLEEIITGEIAWWFNIKYIHMLEQYCNSNNIKFVWSTWDHDTANVFFHHQKYFNNFINSELLGWTKDSDNKDIYLNDKCHLDLKKENEYLFYLGGDRLASTSRAHWGTHKHAHTAEQFIKYIDQNFNI